MAPKGSLRKASGVNSLAGKSGKKLQEVESLTNWELLFIHPKLGKYILTLRILGMSWGVKTTCLEAPGVSLEGSGVSIGGVRSLRVV